MKTIVLFACVLSALCAAENVVQTKPGGTVILECGSLEPTTNFKWLREDQQLSSTNAKTGMTGYGDGDFKSRIKVKNEKNLEISNVKTGDAGRFTCRVDGTQEEFTRLVVVSVSAVPSNNLEAGSNARLQCDVAGLTQGSLVEWARPDGVRIHHPSVDLTPVALSDAGLWKCVFTADGKTMTEGLTITVTDMRPKPTSKAPFSTRMTEDNNMHACPGCNDIATNTTPTLAGLSWWMWAAVGGGGLVFVLLWVFILVMYSQMKRRKKRYQKMMMKMNQVDPKQYCQCTSPTAAAKPQPGRRKEKASAPPLPPLPVHHR